MVKFVKDQEIKNVEDPTVAVVIWEWKDTNLLGRPANKIVDEVRMTACTAWRD